jgi:tetratricopeptide (TPR) repeat protein
MTKWTQFECPHCHEPFQYSPAQKVEQQIAEMELKTGKGGIIMVECPHCPETLIINRETGRTTRFEKAIDASDVGSVFWDMSFTENGKEQVKKLITEGNQISASNLQKAETIFRKAIAIRKHDPFAWYNLGVCQHRLGDAAGAEKSYRHALEYDPTIEQAWNNLGTCLAEQNQLIEANECFDRGIAVNANNPKFYLGKGNVAAMRRDFAGARRFMNMALQKDPSYQRAREGLQRIDMMEKMY